MKHKYVTYPAIFKPLHDDVYFVSFPDVKSAVTEGHGLEDAFIMAFDALATMLYDEKRLPTMTNPADLKVEKGSFVALVTADLTQAADNFEKTIRKNVTVPYNIAKKAEDMHLNFSKVLTDALKEKLNYPN